jgi:hypothetical protein
MDPESSQNSQRIELAAPAPAASASADETGAKEPVAVASDAAAAPPVEAPAIGGVAGALNYFNPADGRFVLLAVFDSSFEANLAAAKLEAADVVHTVSGGGLIDAHYYRASEQVRLLVWQEHLPIAIDILIQTPARRFLRIRDDEASDTGAAARCPHCDSVRVADVSRSGAAKLVGVVLLGLPLMFERRKRRCLDCQRMWSVQ